MGDAVLDPRPFIKSAGQRIEKKYWAPALKHGSATLHEAAGKIGAMDRRIKPVVPGFQISGPAVPVMSPPGDNLWLHRAIYAAQPGDILVIHVNGAYEHGYWGEIMSTAAQERKLGGMIIDGCVRDVALLAEVGFPIFAHGLCIRGTGKDFTAPGHVNMPTWFGDVRVFPGDLVVGDADGVVVLPQARVPEILAASVERERVEADIVAALKMGETTLDLYGWNLSPE